MSAPAPRGRRSFEGGGHTNGGPRRVALSRAEAAEAIGVSIDTLEREVIPSIRVARVGRRVLIGVRELERWIEDRSSYGATL